MDRTPRTPKKVRFAGVPPSTPSPASSSASLYSSPAGPSTPPRLFLEQRSPTIIMPTEYPPWQQKMPAAVHPPIYPALTCKDPVWDLLIDPLLAAPTHSANSPPLLWDLIEHPNAVKLSSRIGSHGARPLSREDLASCAVRTSARGSPLLLRRIVLVFPGLPLQIEVVPADSPVWTSVPLPYLTVGDVLYGLYKALRTSVEPHEFNGLERAHREAMIKAFKKRLRNEPDNVDKNVEHGVRRVDYLGNVRRFVGLRPARDHELSPGRRRGEVFVVILSPVS